MLLKKGINDLKYILPGSQKKEYAFRLTYKPTGNPRKLRAVYAYLKSSGGKFWDNAEKKTKPKEEMINKIGLSVLMYQTMLAECLKNAGFGPMTFEIMRTKKGGIVHEMEIDMTEEAFAKGDRQLRKSMFKKAFPYNVKIQDAYIAAYNINHLGKNGPLKGSTVANRALITIITKKWGYNPTTLHDLNWAFIDDKFLYKKRQISDSINGVWTHEGGHAFYGQHTLKEGIMNSGGGWIYNYFLLINAYKYYATDEITLVESIDPIPVAQPQTALVHYMNPWVNAAIPDKYILPRPKKNSGVKFKEDKEKFHHRINTGHQDGGILRIQFFWR